MKFCVASMTICHWFPHKIIPRYSMLLIIESNVWDQGEGGVKNRGYDGIVLCGRITTLILVRWGDKNARLIN